MNRILLCVVQSQGHWRSISTELFPNRHRGWSPHPSQREVEAAVQTLKKRKSAGVENSPAELVQAGEEDVVTALMTICNKMWQTGEWSTPWTQSLIITLPKKGNLQQCQNYRTISLICHQSKVMLKIILKDLIHKQRRSSPKNRQASEQEGAPQSRSSTYESSMRNISSTSKTSTMSS